MSDVEIQRQRMERILGFSRELTSTVSLKPLLQKIVEAAVELTSSEVASILLLDDRTGELRFAASSGSADQLTDISVSIERSIAGVALTSGEPLLVSDVRTDPRFYKVVARQIGFDARSLMAVPLQFKDRQGGVLMAENKRGAEGFGQEDMEMLTALAAQAAVAIENARMVEALRQARDLAEALRQASAALSSTLNYDEVLDRILEQMSHVVPYDAANVMLIEGPEGEEVARVFRGRGYERFGTAAALTSISLDVADTANLRKMQQTGQPLAVPYVERNAEWVYSRPEHAGIKSYVGVPIRIRDRTTGFLNVNSTTPGFFSQADAERAQNQHHHQRVAPPDQRAQAGRSHDGTPGHGQHRGRGSGTPGRFDRRTPGRDYGDGGMAGGAGPRPVG